MTLFSHRQDAKIGTSARDAAMITASKMVPNGLRLLASHPVLPLLHCPGLIP